MASTSPDSRGRLRQVLGWIAAGWLGVLPVLAGINVVSLPGRDSVQLTIYNSVDLTMVKETRHLTFRQGLNRLEFSWANTLIDPTSVEFRALNPADAVEVLDVSFPPRVTNTLEWRLHSEYAGDAEVEIRYFTSGIRWAADYVAEATQNEKAMDLAGYVRVTNQSGEDYGHAQVRLVVGVIRLVEEIAALARESEGRSELSKGTKVKSDTLNFRRLSGALGQAIDKTELDALARPKEITKQSLSEYFLYAVEGRDSIPNGWSKRLPSFQASAVPLTSLGKYEQERWGGQVMRYYRFTNAVPSRLGQEPLPDGEVNAFRWVTEDKLFALVGRTAVKYIPINETVEMELGADPEVLVKPSLMNWEKDDLRFDPFGNVAGWTTLETWQIEVQNSRPLPVNIEIRRHGAGDWSLNTRAPYEKLDATTVKFTLRLEPREQRHFSYILTTRHGFNAIR